MTNRSSELIGLPVGVSIDLRDTPDGSKFGHAAMTDVFSDIFDLIKLKSCVYFQRDFCGPWSMRIEGTGFAQFHILTRGTCVLETGGAWRDCSVGDILFFPHGLGHTLADSPCRDPVPGPQAMASFAGDEPLFANGDAITRLICGHYEYRMHHGHPLICDLPAVIHLRSTDTLHGAHGASVLPLLMNELSHNAPGTSSVAERYAEILLIQTLRQFYAEDNERVGFLAGLADPRLQKAVNLMHRDVAQPLALHDLAREAAMSRSSFADLFREKTGMPPIEYLAKWRMLTAGNLLLSTDRPIVDVALRVGYESDISFARAFKREFGVTPAAYRRTDSGSVGVETQR